MEGMEPPTVTGHKNTFWKKEDFYAALNGQQSWAKKTVYSDYVRNVLSRKNSRVLDRARIACSMFQALIYHSFKIKTKQDIFL